MASLGYEVLCRAIDRWEPERGPMGPWCRQQIWGRISDALHLANRRLRPVSLDLTDPNSGLTLLDRIADECSSDGLAWGATRARQDLGRAYATYVDLLPPLESAIVRAVMGLGDEQEPHTLEVIGKRYGVSRQRVGKVYQRALKRLRGYKVPTDPTWPTFEAGRKEAFPVS
jgi:DNA-directed RNA polymerase sigma subunit (sigma70/sigma32)